MWWARITCHCQAVVNYWGNFIFIFSNWSAWLCCNCLRLGFVYHSLFSQKIFGWSFLFSVFLPLFNHFCHEQLTLKMQCFCKDFFLLFISVSPLFFNALSSSLTYRIWSRNNMMQKVAVRDGIPHAWYKMATIWIHFICPWVLIEARYWWFTVSL